MKIQSLFLIIIAICCISSCKQKSNSTSTGNHTNTPEYSKVVAQVALSEHDNEENDMLIINGKMIDSAEWRFIDEADYAKYGVPDFFPTPTFEFHGYILI